MSWLYSIVIAGLMFSNDGFLTTGKQNSYKQTNVPQIVKLDETERFEQTYPLNSNGRVNVSNINGSITVEAWDNPQVKLEAVKTGDSKETLAEVEIKVDAQANSFSVETDYLNLRREGEKGWKNARKLEVQFRLTVPRTAVLDEIETVNGSVTVSNFTNYTKVSAVNGEVKATNLRGTANLETVNGTVEADFDRLESGSKISLETVNGRINLRIPSDSNATVKADTINGIITNDFGLPVRKGEYVGKDLYGRIGSGDVQIKLNSVNGGLSINRKDDGKTPNQPTNLLNEKNKNNDNWDDDAVYIPRINTAKINKDIAKSLKDSEKEIAAAMKEAEKEMKEAEIELKDLEPLIEQVTEDAVVSSMESLKVLDSKQLAAQIKLAETARKDALARLADANFSYSTPSITKQGETFSVKGTPKVSIDAKGCGVTVRGWDKQEVQYVVKKFSRSRTAPSVESKAVQNNSEVKITVANSDKAAQEGDFFDDRNIVRVEVYVPKKSNLKIVTNGEIRLENISGEIDLSGADEAINVRDVDGKLKFASVDARVRIIGFQGELDAKTVDGEVYLEGDFSKISARSTDGNYILTMPATANAIFSSNTEVESEGFNLIKDGEQTWRAGKGGENYNFQFTDGKLIVRNSNLIGKN